MVLPKSYDYVLGEMIDFTDPRTIEWTLISSPAPLIRITFFYLFIVCFAGPRFMKNRQPYSVKKFMYIYNIFQVIANFSIVFNVVKFGGLSTAILRHCKSLDEICGSNTEKQLEIMWWTLILKTIDLIETIIFILRKKQRQISFLHLYHHISTIFLVWSIIRHLSCGFVLSLLVINCSVHVMMYSYYFLTTLGPNIQRRILPYKKWITVIQLIQFVILMLLSLQSFSSSCDKKRRYPGIIIFFCVAINLLFFLNFYKNSYKKSKVMSD